MEILSSKSIETLLGKPKTGILKITPEIAQHILSRNMNRRVKSQTVNMLADLMEKDLFDPFNGETIKIAGNIKDGTLLDGQHRLFALIKANKTYEFIVVTNIDEKLFTTIDIGIKRTIGDMFEINKISSGRNKGAIISSYLKLNYRKENDETHTLDKGLNRYSISPDEVLAKYYEHQELIDSVVNEVNALYMNFRILGVGYLGGMMLWTILHSKHNEECMDEFWRPLMTGDNINSKPTVQLCRNLLIQELGKKQTSREPMNIYVGWVIKAYNCYFKDKVGLATVQKLKYRSKLDKDTIFI